MTVDVLPYDDSWPRAFEAERTLLEQSLAPWLSEGVHHIGSTAVPGLRAKPIIDMVAGVRDLREALHAPEALDVLGYVHAPHRTDALWYYKPASGERHFQLHLTVPGSPLWRERLAFRDLLRADPARRAAYARLKQSLAAQHRHDGRGYAEAKRPFVAELLHTAGIQLEDRPDVRASDSPGPP